MHFNDFCLVNKQKTCFFALKSAMVPADPVVLFQACLNHPEKCSKTN